MGPTRESERIMVLDAVRGVAIFGILPVNLVSFAMPMQGGMEHAEFLASGDGERAAFYAVHALFFFKFISLFSLLFGVGMGLQQERAQMRGADLGGRYAWRNTILLGIGLCHALLLWYGDILFWYAAVGLFLTPFAALPRRLHLLGGLGALLVPVALCLLAALAMLTTPDLPAAPQAPETLQAALADPHLENARWYDLHPGRETLVYRDGTYGDAVAQRLVSWGFLAVAMIFYGWRVLGLFLLGQAIHAYGWFKDPAAHGPLLRRLLYAGLFVGLPLELWVSSLALDGDPPGALRVFAEAVHQVSSLLMTLGILAGVLLLSLRGERARRVLRPFSAAGRMALSNYLGHTVICTTIFYSYGFAKYGSITRVGLWRLWLGIVVFQLVFSTLWMERFRFGPVEWLWRSLTHLKPQPFLRERTHALP